MPHNPVIAAFMLGSICLYVVMPKLLSHVAVTKQADRIFFVVWAVMTLAGVGLATSTFLWR